MLCFFDRNMELPDYQCMDIYAEGTWQKPERWRENLLRSVSVEFKCIDKIYEENIRRGLIKDADSDCRILIEKVKKAENVAALGTDMEAQDAYNFLLKNGVEAACFCGSGGGHSGHIGIIGSCVSRDVFGLEDEGKVAVEFYFARSSVISLVSKPIIYCIKDTREDLEFNKRMRSFDLDKSCWNSIKNKCADYLMIDFVDERFPIGKIGDGYFTLADGFKESGWVKDYKEIERVKNGTEYLIDGIPLTYFMDQFFARIKSFFAENRIILHKVVFKDYYVSIDGKRKRFSDECCRNNEKINLLLEFMYSYAERKLPDSILIDCAGHYDADAKHKWGLAPMHYQREYYSEVYECLGGSLLNEEKGVALW